MNVPALARRPGAAVRREVRQRCGFGCVLCGRAVIDYEHFDPPFAECTEHKAEGITLLCPSCHALKERNWYSVEKIAEANQSPFCKKNGFSFGPFDLGRKVMPEVSIGVVVARNTSDILRIHGDALLSVKEPEVEGGPFLLSARLFDISGKEIFSIVDNEWRTHSANWDVQAEGGRITIHREARDIALQLRLEAPTRLVVERLNMFHKGVKISCREGHPLVLEEGANKVETFSMEIDGCQAGIVFEAGNLMIGVGGGAVSGVHLNVSRWSGNPRDDHSFSENSPKAQTTSVPMPRPGPLISKERSDQLWEKMKNKW